MGEGWLGMMNGEEYGRKPEFIIAKIWLLDVIISQEFLRMKSFGAEYRTREHLSMNY
jgi:hypothetical protein